MPLQEIIYILQVIMIIGSLALSVISLIKQRKGKQNDSEKEEIDKVIKQNFQNAMQNIDQILKEHNQEIKVKELKKEAIKTIKGV